LIPEFICRRHIESVEHGSFDGAALFLDISGFTPLTTALMARGASGAEELSRILGVIFAPIIEAVHENDGFVTTFAGDALTAVFPGPPATAVGAARAVGRTARTVIDREHLQRTASGEFALEAGIGIGYGAVEWGIVGSDDTPLSYYFRGDALEQAYAAEARGGPGEVGLSETAQRKETEQGAQTERVLDTPASGDSTAAFATTLPGNALDTAQRRFRPIDDIPTHRAGEFREVASLFLAADAGDTHDEINETMTCVLRSASAFGGYFDVLDFGDKGCVALILFGAPVSRGQEADRAAGCARDILDSLGRRARIGITEGTVFAGYLGNGERGTYTALGETINLSARLAPAAEPVTAVMHEKVATHLAGRFRLSDPKSLDLKGVSHGTTARVLGESGAVGSGSAESGSAGRGDGDTGAGSSRSAGSGRGGASESAPARREKAGSLVGRHEELGTLREWLDGRSSASGLRVLEITGEAGSGKTHLLEHALQTHPAIVPDAGRDQDGPEPAPEGSAPSGGPPPVVLSLTPEPILAKSMNLFFDLVPEVCRTLGEPDPSTSATAEWRDRLVAYASGLDSTLGAELEENADALPALMDLPGGKAYREREGRARYEMPASAAVALIRSLLRERPVVLVAEDLHATDPDSRAMLERIWRACLYDPLDCVLVRRPPDESTAPDPALPEGIEPVYLEVPPLQPAGLGELATSVLNAPVAPQLADFLFRRVGGNPFYARELVQYLKQSGRLVRTSDGYAVSGDESDIPHSVTAVLVQRLDALDPDVRETAAIAAVIGLEFDAEQIAAVDATAGTSSALEKGSRAGLWHETEHRRYRFSQSLVREGLLSMQLESERQRIHSAVFDALAPGLSDDPARHAELAHHAEQAGRISEALTHLWGAFEYARANFKNERAESFLRRYLALCKDPADTMRVHVELGSLYEMTGDWETAGSSLIQALGLAVVNRDTPQRIAILTSLTRIFSRQGRAGDAISVGEQAISAAEKAGQDSELSAALTAVGRALWTAGRLEEAKQSLIRAAETGEGVEDPKNAGLALYYHGVVERDRSEYASALELFNRSRSRLEEYGDPQLTSFPLYDIGILSQYEGNLERSQEAFEHVLEIYRRTGYRSGESAAVLNVGVLRDRRGDFKGAIAYFEEALEIAKEIGEHLAIAYTLFSIGATYYKMRDNRKALVYLKDALKLMRSLGAEGYYGYALSYLAALYARTGDANRVISICTYHRQAVDRVGSDPENGLALLSLARVPARGARVSPEWAGALADLGRYYGVDPDNPETLFLGAIERSRSTGYVNTLIPARFHYAHYLRKQG